MMHLERMARSRPLSRALESAAQPALESKQSGRLVAVVLACGAVAAAWSFMLQLQRANGLASPAYDQAIFQQLMWSLWHGHWFSTSFAPVSYMGVHFSPLLLLPAALWPLWPDARLLILLNSVSLALAAPAAWAFLRAGLRNVSQGHIIAAVLAGLLPFGPVMQEAAHAGFHPEAMALPAALTAAWAGLSGRRRWLWPAAGAALLAKEDQAYTVAIIGLVVTFHGQKRLRGDGVALMALGAIWAAAMLLVVMPLIRHGVWVDTSGYYRWLWTATPDAVVSALIRPAAWLSILGLLLGVAGLALLAPRWLALSVAPIAADMLSSHYPQFELRLHYGLIAVFPLLVAGMLGAQRLLASGRLPAGALGALGLPALAAGYLIGPLPPAPYGESFLYDRPPAMARLLAFTAVIPPGAPIAADDGLCPPLAGRPQIDVFPRSSGSEYVVIDRKAVLPVYVDHGDRAARIAELPASRQLLADDGRFQVWSRAQT